MFRICENSNSYISHYYFEINNPIKIAKDYKKEQKLEQRIV